MTAGAKFSVHTSSFMSKIVCSSSWSGIRGGRPSSSGISSMEAITEGRGLSMAATFTCVTFFNLEFFHAEGFSIRVGALNGNSRGSLLCFLVRLILHSMSKEHSVAGSDSVPSIQLISGFSAFNHGSPNRILSHFVSLATLNFPIIVLPSILTVRTQYREIRPPAASDPSAVITGKGLESLWVLILCSLQKVLLKNVPEALESTTMEVSMVFIRFSEMRVAGTLSSFLSPSDCISCIGMGSTDVETGFHFKNPSP